jgi:hypothetical protein
VQILEHLGNGPLRPFLGDTFAGLTDVMKFLFPVIKHFDSELVDFFEGRDIDPAIFICHILTYFTHTGFRENACIRLLDFFIASHPLMSIYVMTTLCIIKKHVIMNPDENGPMSAIMNLLADVDVGIVIPQSVLFFRQYPPSVVLFEEKSLKVSSALSYLHRNARFGYEFPNFPMIDYVSWGLWNERLDESNSLGSVLYRAILNFARAIGMIQ